VAPTGEVLELVAQLSSHFVNVRSSELDATIHSALRRIVSFFDLDRGAFFKVDAGRHLAEFVHRVGSTLTAPLPAQLGRNGLFSWLYGAVVDRGETIAVSSLDQLPADAATDAQILRSSGVRSALLIPLPPSLPVGYVLALASDRQERQWTAAQIAQLRLLGEVFVGAIERKLLEDAQHDALRFEHVIANVLSGFARVDADRLDQQIQATLEELLAFAQVDQFGIFTVDQEAGWVHLTHTARAEGIPAVPSAYDFAKQAPWLYQRLVLRKETFAFTRADEFPPEAAADRMLIELRGTRSGLYIPLQVDGKVRQILAVVSSRRERQWPSRFVEQLTVLGEVIVTALSRKATAAERLRSESNLAEAQRIANLGSWEWDVAADQVTTSEQCDRIQGFRIRKFDDFMAAIHPDDRDGVRRKVEQDMVPPHTKGILEYRIRRRDGNVRFVRDVYEFVLDAEGRPARVIGTIQDITEQTLMRQQLRRAQQFAQSTLNAFHKCLCVIDSKGTVVEVSDGWPVFAQASGWAELSTGSDYFKAMEASQGPHAAQARKVAEGVQAVVGRRQDEFALELAFDGTAGTRHFYTKVNHFELEGVGYAAISHEDITHRKSSEIELQNLRTQHWHSERVTRTGLLISSLAHELSQPLTAILSNAQAGLRFLAHDAPDLKEIGEILKDITADDKRAGEIIESLRVMLRRQQSERQLIDLAALAGEVTVLLNSELVANQVELESDLAAGCLALVDRAQIQQVLLNLLMNAMEAMAATPLGQRQLQVGVRSSGQGEVQVSVRDSGPGITQEEFKKVFDAFWTTKSRGTGMGLAISRSIVESHGGRIWVDSKDGEGSTFFVSLPAAAAARAAAGGAKGER
jgi:PAS domain S-box-containing protein